MSTVCLRLLLLPLLQATFAHEVTVELDRLASRAGVEKCRLRPRGNASNAETVILYNGEILTHNFCLKKRKSFRLENLRYSNDGVSDVLTIDLDGEEVGRLKTRGEFGNGTLWNQILEVEQFDGAVTVGVAAGNHKLTIRVANGDRYGVELDSLTFSLYPDDDSLCKNTGSQVITPLFGECDPDANVCGSPPTLPNADVLYKGSNVGATATYKCLGDFVFCGKSSKHRCSSIGEWEGLQGACFRTRWQQPQTGIDFDVSLPWGVTNQYKLEVVATLTVRQSFTVSLVSVYGRMFHLEVRCDSSSIYPQVYLSSNLLNVHPFTVGTQFRLVVFRKVHSFQVTVNDEFIGEQCNTYPSTHTGRLVISRGLTIKNVAYIQWP